MNKTVNFLLKLQATVDIISVFLKKTRGFLLTVWLRGMQWLCIAFLLVHSQFVDINFTVFCVVVIFTINYAMSISKTYRETNSQNKKLLRWVAIVLITVTTAYLWGWIAPLEEGDKAVSNFVLAAIESGLVVAFVEGVIKLINKVETRAKKKTPKKNKQVRS